MLENASTYAEFASSSMPEWEFFARLMADADCGMLLDVNNVYVSSFNHGFDPEAVPRRDRPRRASRSTTSPATRTRARTSSTRTTTHVIDAVWELYRRSVARTGNVSTLLEWDADIPEFDVVHAEALKARRVPARGEGRCRPPLELPLPRIQRWMQAVIEQPGTVDEAVEADAARAELDPADIDRVILPSKTLTPVERVGVYQGMYLLRMIEALEGDYPAVAHLLGDEAFAALVTRYVAAHPSVSYTFNRLGRGFPEFVRASPGVRKRAFAADLARLELAITEVFDAPQSPAWPAEEIARIPEDAWAGAVFQPDRRVSPLRVRPSGQRVPPVGQGRRPRPPRHRRARRRGWRCGARTTRSGASTSTKPAYDFLAALAKGRPFGKAVAAAAKGLQGDPGEQLFRWLRDWVAEGMFESVDVSR